MNNSLPISQLVISAVIPANTSHAVIDIDPKSFMDFNGEGLDLSINSVVVKTDTTSLWNIKETNTVVARNSSGTRSIVLEPGYYNQEALQEAFGNLLTFTDDGYCHPSGAAYDLVMNAAPDLRRILSFDSVQATYVKGHSPVDISGGLNVLQIYTNLMKQILPYQTSPLCCCMIYSTMGLNNVNTFSHMNVPAVKMSDLRSIQFDVFDRLGNPVKIPANIYINLRLSINVKA